MQKYPGTPRLLVWLKQRLPLLRSYTSVKALPANTAHFCLGKNNLPASNNFLYACGIWVFTEMVTPAESPPEPVGSAGQLLTPAADESKGCIDHSL